MFSIPTTFTELESNLESHKVVRAFVYEVVDTLWIRRNPNHYTKRYGFVWIKWSATTTNVIYMC